MKKIAMIVPTISTGGAEKVAADLSLYFEGKGYEVIFFVRMPAAPEDYMYAGKVIQIPRTYNETKFSYKKNLWLMYKDASTLKKLKRTYQIDVSISFLQDCNLINILSRHRDKVIVTLHSVMSERKEILGGITANKWVFRYLYQLADRIIFVSEYCQKDWIRNYGDLFHKSKVIYNPIGYVRRNHEAGKYGDKVVISVARLELVKRPWHIVRMFSRVLKEFPDAHLIMLGAGSLMTVMKRLAKKMKLESSVNFLGYVENVDDYLNMAKVFVLASESESFGCSIVEAMRFGVPIVVNDCPGGIREILGVGERPRYKKHNLKTKCGIITPYLNGKRYGADDELSKEEEAMADAVIKILSDSVLYDEFSTNSRKNADKFCIDNIGSVWEKEIIG